MIIQTRQRKLLPERALHFTCTGTVIRLCRIVPVLLVAGCVLARPTSHSAASLHNVFGVSVGQSGVQLEGLDLIPEWCALYLVHTALGEAGVFAPIHGYAKHVLTLETEVLDTIPADGIHRYRLRLQLGLAGSDSTLWERTATGSALRGDHRRLIEDVTRLSREFTRDLIRANPRGREKPYVFDEDDRCDGIDPPSTAPRPIPFIM